MKKIKVLVITLVIALSSLLGCSLTSDNSVNQTRNEDISRQVVISNIEEYKTSLLNLIKTGENNTMFIEEFFFSEYDIVRSAEINNSYIFNNAIYLQINNEYMYRFQLNSSTKLIESYIRYQLEG